jgi:HAMP domain-containing protein
VQTFTIIGLIGCAVCAVVLLLIVRMLIKPVVQLRDVAQKVSRGELEHNITTRFTNEVGQLSLAFNSMVQSIRKGIEDLETEKKSVEKKVDDATRESEMRKKYLAFSVEVILSEMRRFAGGNLAVELTPAVENDENRGIIYRV